MQGIAMLNPQRWGGSNVAVGGRDNAGYSKNLDKDGAMLFEVEEDDEYHPSMKEADVDQRAFTFF